MSAAVILGKLPRRRGREATNDGRRVFDLFPRNGGNFVYVIAFGGGIVKVGRCQCPRERMREHWRTAEGEVLWAHLFERGSTRYASTAERYALAALGRACERVNKSEWFRCELTKAEVVAIVRPVIARAKVDAANWDAEAAAATHRHVKAMQLLAEHEAAQRLKQHSEA